MTNNPIENLEASEFSAKCGSSSAFCDISAKNGTFSSPKFPLFVIVRLQNNPKHYLFGWKMTNNPIENLEAFQFSAKCDS